MATLRVTGVQMRVSDKLADNLETILDRIEHADSDFVVFPEMSLTGHRGDFGQAAAERAWDQIAATCRQTYTTAIVGTGCVADGNTYSQCRVYGIDGALIGTHEKLVPTEAERAYCRPGEELRTFESESLRFGCLIGNDLWVAPGFGPYPDRRLLYQLGKLGARVVFHANDSGTDASYSGYYRSNLSLRARESRSYIVTANAAPDSGELNAPSGVVDPTGKFATECPASGEQEFSYDIELD